MLHLVRGGPIDATGRAAILMLEAKLRAAWMSPVPRLDLQWLHSDFRDSNVIFEAHSDDVAAIIDWDHLHSQSPGYEAMRAFALSLPPGDPSGVSFLEGYSAEAKPTPSDAASYVDLWSYFYLIRVWPVDVRYEQPHPYQERWNEFIRPPDGWWEANRERVRRELVRLAREAAS